MIFPFTLQQLRILRAIAAEQNFTKAADTLYLSQPSLSKQLKVLENNLGVILINRNDKQRFITKNGKLVLKYAERILALCEESCRALNNLKNEERENLAIGVTQTIDIYLFSKLFVFFTKKYPQITLNFQVHADEVLLKHVYQKVIDIAIVNENVINFRGQKLAIAPFVVTKLDFIVSKFHLSTLKKKVNKNDIYLLKYISLKTEFVEKLQLSNLLKQNEINSSRLKPLAKLHSINQVKAAVNLTLGSAFVPTWAFSKNESKNYVTPIKIKKFYIIFLKNKKKSEIFKFFHAELLKFKIDLCT